MSRRNNNPRADSLCRGGSNLVEQPGPGVGLIIFQGKLETDPDGYLLVRHLAESKHSGVFIAGDVADRVYKQAVTAAGSGCCGDGSRKILEPPEDLVRQ
jgi:hypothetical protein